MEEGSKLTNMNVDGDVNATQVETSKIKTNNP
jgi:hypothetical protein